MHCSLWKEEYDDLQHKHCTILNINFWNFKHTLQYKPEYAISTPRRFFFVFSKIIKNVENAINTFKKITFLTSLIVLRTSLHGS